MWVLDAQHPDRHATGVNPELDEFKKWFGPRLTELRQQHGFTAPRLAKEALIAIGHLRDMEACRVVPRIETLLAMARVMKISVRRFFQ